MMIGSPIQLLDKFGLAYTDNVSHKHYSMDMDIDMDSEVAVSSKHAGLHLQSQSKEDAKARQSALRTSDSDLRSHIEVVTQDVLAMEKCVATFIYVPEALLSCVSEAKAVLATLKDVLNERPKLKKNKVA